MPPAPASVFDSTVSAGNVGEQGRGSTPFETADGQMALFAPRVVLTRDMEEALGRGRFEEAGRLRLMIEATYGPSPATRGLGFLDRLGGRLWESPTGIALSVWAEVDGHLQERPHLRARLRGGVFARLLETRSAEELAAAKPECLPALTLVLGASPDSPEDGRRRSRGLIRDALLAGRGLLSLDFKHDPPVADLLAEDFSPRWLACLGFLRRLWSAPRPDCLDLTKAPSAPAGIRSDDEAAVEFWESLCVADSVDCPDELVHEARRRMKHLRPELHALYMKRAGGRPSSIVLGLHP